MSQYASVGPRVLKTPVVSGGFKQSERVIQYVNWVECAFFKFHSWRYPTRFRAMEKSPEYEAFMTAYRAFIKSEVAPLCGDPTVVFRPAHHSSRHALDGATIQPTATANIRGTRTQRSTFGFPTKVWGNNTLHLESSPGAGDYHPVEMDVGTPEFNGYHCRHFTNPNTRRGWSIPSLTRVFTWRMV